MFLPGSVRPLGSPLMGCSTVPGFVWDCSGKLNCSGHFVGSGATFSPETRPFLMPPMAAWESMARWSFVTQSRPKRNNTAGTAMSSPMSMPPFVCMASVASGLTFYCVGVAPADAELCGYIGCCLEFALCFVLVCIRPVPFRDGNSIKNFSSSVAPLLRR